MTSYLTTKNILSKQNSANTDKTQRQRKKKNIKTHGGQGLTNNDYYVHQSKRIDSEHGALTIPSTPNQQKRYVIRSIIISLIWKST